MLIIFTVVIMIPFIIFILFYTINFKGLKSKEKLSPFECGFDPFSFSRVPFSLKFFFIGIIFLIFDVEIIIIIPFPLLMNFNYSLFVSFLMINLIIFFGLIYEWKLGMIDWLK
uniref:NADH-ubiquinone oxidoreductase chain 3 n=1 Tax=Haemaphysalis tibetensis TaxID=1811858 RepID=A0A976MZ48_9ACAR|nr:NADH dehydrogenase subunit 3 [Haemaphysalis tibetensis]UNO54046.1 NADH dehydrogenase subunit 3 [Haemaphysalis tibetensis]UNO54085.1 NADH dehydrogenase subunit 3 [Haemaphysalis tibetensis]UTV01450.1 NADH dehydrogenase subunit 3 [Haemaphysalis tibetensis]